jgi:PrtD family type I secretion system ABC transporter
MLQAHLDPEQRPGQQVLRDAETIRDTVANGAAAILCDLPWTPIFVLLCFAMHPLLGFVALGGAAILFTMALITEYMTKSSVENTTMLTNRASTIVNMALRNGDAIRGLGMADTLQDRWSTVQAQAVVAMSQSQERTAIFMALTKFARLGVQTALLCAGAYLALQREISPGSIMAASIVMGRALAPVEQAVGQWKRILACRQAHKRLTEHFARRPQAATHTQLPAPLGRLDLENAYVVPPASPVPTVKGVSLSLAPGETLGIIGTSASGKSSLARAIAGVWPTREGMIRLDGASLSQWDPNQLGKHTGYLPQDVVLFAGTVADNIARMQTVDAGRVIEAAMMAGVHEAILRLPKGYDTMIGDDGSVLSGGMRQRIGLARALFGAPRLVVLDEPNANLDEEGERALGETLIRLKATKCTVIVVTHRPSVLINIDKLLVLSLGSQIAFGPRDEVLAKVKGNRVSPVAQPKAA